MKPVGTVTIGNVFSVSAAAFQYLRIQKGSLDEYAHDREEWHRRYEDDLVRQFQSIAPHLPARCGQMLDVGSGLGGIDVLVRRYYTRDGGACPFVCLVDGIADPPCMTLHRETFNDMEVARAFQEDNGLPPGRLSCIAPEHFAAHGAQAKADLVMSSGAWCFHVAPMVYLQAVLRTTAPGATLILDVRSTKDSWRRELEARFHEVAIAAQKPKWRRIVYRARA